MLVRATIHNDKICYHYSSYHIFWGIKTSNLMGEKTLYKLPGLKKTSYAHIAYPVSNNVHLIYSGTNYIETNSKRLF